MADTSPGILTVGGDVGDEVSLLDILDHVLNSGVVLHGNLVISLAGVDLVYVGLNVLLTSIETARQSIARQEARVHPKSAARPRGER